MSRSRGWRRWFRFPVRSERSFWDMNDRQQREFVRELLSAFQEEIGAKRAPANSDTPRKDA